MRLVFVENGTDCCVLLTFPVDVRHPHVEKRILSLPPESPSPNIQTCIICGDCRPFVVLQPVFLDLLKRRFTLNVFRTEFLFQSHYNNSKGFLRGQAPNLKLNLHIQYTNEKFFEKFFNMAKSWLNFITSIYKEIFWKYFEKFYLQYLQHSIILMFSNISVYSVY